jgi:hypothetical protein
VVDPQSQPHPSVAANPFTSSSNVIPDNTHASDPLGVPSHTAITSRGRRPTVIGHGGGDALDLSAFVTVDEEGEGLTLEEIGKRRHREWVERNKKERSIV